MATILVADDRPLNRQYLVSLLGYFGHHMVEASDGAEALKVAKTVHPSLVITDLVMPVMDGHELAVRMHSDSDLAAVPVIFYSATYSLQQAEKLGAAVGVFGVLPKPSGPEEILKTVNAALGLPPWSEEGNSNSPVFPAPAPAIGTLPQGLADLAAHADRLSTIIEMSLELAAEADPERLLQVLAHATRKLIGSKHTAVGLCSDNTNTVWAFFSSGAGEADGSGAVVSRITAPRMSAAPPPGSVLARLIEDGRSQRTCKADAADLGIEIGVSQTGLVFQSVLAVPLLSDGVLFGWILLLDKLAGEEFSEEDERVASTLASQGAIAHQRLSERRAGEEHLRQSQAMFESLFESAPDALLATDSRGLITQVNAQAERMFGYARRELAGQAVEILVPERFRGKHPAHREAYCTDPRLRPMGVGLELYGRRKDGTEFPIDLMLNTMKGDRGVVVLSVVRDVTARKLAEEQIHHLNAQLGARVHDLQAANESLESFSYSVSHDLRAPLRAIGGFARILQEEHGAHLDHEEHRLLTVISDSVARMGQLIEGLLRLSRVSRADMSRSRIDMAALAQGAVDELQTSEPDRQVEVGIGPLPFADGDRIMVRQVFINLISNAWKFTRATPQAAIDIGALRQGEETVYYVKDNGAGFPQEYAAKLFGVFQRLHGADQFEGTGIGLALVRQIVQRHGGRIWGQGKVGSGASFHFTLKPAEEIPAGAKEG